MGRKTAFGYQRRAGLHEDRLPALLEVPMEVMACRAVGTVPWRSENRSKMWTKLVSENRGKATGSRG